MEEGRVAFDIQGDEKIHLKKEDLISRYKI